MNDHGALQSFISRFREPDINRKLQSGGSTLHSQCIRVREVTRQEAVCPWEEVFPSSVPKSNTRSSTETEIVRIDDCMPSVPWTRCFVEAPQGCGIQENISFQDNKSAILMKKNGKASSSKRTKHIDTRCHFVTDRINKKNGVQPET
jgi:hypothetical protein